MTHLNSLTAELRADAEALRDDVTTVNKVAEVTLAFWIMKICATTLGETAGDMFSMTFDLGYAASSILLISAFLIALVWQMSRQGFNPALYWAVILATSTAGTTMSDFLDRSLALGYATGAGLLVSLLVAVLIVWRLVTGSLSVTRISDRRSEAFYWLAILVSNTLGTALGDFLADSGDLGYLASNLLISGAIGLIIAAYFTTRLSRTALFWAAFVLTRPFGATMGDLLTKTPAKGGLGFGTIGSSSVLVAVLVALIVFTIRRAKVSTDALPASAVVAE